MTSKVIVVGGGYAGVSAATSLAEQGFQVDLLESRGSLGGRVYSTAPSESFPAPVDNGPHLFMGCYHETLRLFARLNVPGPFHWVDPLGLYWLDPGGKKLSLKCAPLPSPLHLAFGLLTTNAFPFPEKILLARALGVFSKKPFKLPSGMETVAQFLDHSGQGPYSRERFWIPICNAVMNVSPATAPIQGLGEVLKRMFFGSRRDSAVAIAAQPLSGVGFPQVEEFLKTRGGTVSFHEGVQGFNAGSKNFELNTRSGKTYTGDSLIWAVPPSSLSLLWPKGNWPAVEALPRLGKSPILSVHVILSKTVMDEHFAGLPGANFEWVFNRNKNWGWHPAPQNLGGGEGQAQYLSFTASAADKLAKQTEKELVDLALKELKDRCPAARDAQVLHAKVTREMAATFIWNKETDRLRPGPETPFPQVFLAGDWTNTGLPATIEGACLSGHRAAEKVREYLGKNK